jgi:putative hemolysin
LAEVFDAGDRSLREVMIPRTEVDFLTGDTPAYKAVREVMGGTHSRYPVTGDSQDDVLGFVHVRDLVDLDTPTRQMPIKQLVRPIFSLPGTVKVLRALAVMRRQQAHLAIVLDEYGGTAGIVTLEDLVEELVGDITDEYDTQQGTVQFRGNDEYSGLTTLEEFAEACDLLLPEGPYDTLAGYFMAELGRVPQLGDTITATLPQSDSDSDSDQDQPSTPPTKTVTMRVTEMDSRRVAWLSVTESL